MTHDPTESVRRAMLESGQPHTDLATAQEHGEPKWNSAELAVEFTVLSFAAPFVMVIRKFDGRRGTLEFTHYPRWYFNFVED